MLPIHPVLLASFLWLSVYSANQDELFFHDVMVAGMVITGTAVLLVSVLWVATRNAGMSGILSLLALVGMAYYGWIFESLNGLVGGILPEGLFLLLWTALFLGAIVYIVAKRSRFEGLTKTLNIVTLALVVVPVGSLIIGASGTTRIAEAQAGPLLPSPGALLATSAGSRQLPDIYYLVFDRYADNQTLQQAFGYDNRVFLEGLRREGFHVTERSRANYTKTAHSLASSLNLRHLHSLSAQVGPGSSDWKPIYSIVQDNLVARTLKAQGYRYVHLGSWWQPTRESGLADENFDGTPPLPWLDISLNEFEWLLAKPSLLVGAADVLLGASRNKEREQFERVQAKFAKLAAVRRQDAPLFVFAHIMLPHPPYVFHADGRYKTPAEARSLPERQNYVDQLIHTNHLIETLVAELLARDPRPVIILQADEGPFPPRYTLDLEGFDWRQASVEELREKFGILYALYFPDGDYRDLHADITPVNTFRIVFNKYFGAALSMVPDRSYSFPSEADLYTFDDVTDVTR